MNLIFNVKQCTILWHVDNLNISYLDSEIVSRVLADIDAECGKICKNYHHVGQDTQIPWGWHRLLLGRENNILYVWLHWKGVQWNPIRYEGWIINTNRAPPFYFAVDATKLSQTNADLFIILWCSCCNCQRKHAQTYSWKSHYFAI